ncbi:hypothetical protein I203_107217 [Kwoniella mangroviensis CBS 8507]|uniref:hypothetical protein n=1 Tax=Kwoniella mangroviensis CBS 8507 TaxID=1296122 RepID=UPI00080CE460|nr:uncharacterized protein I203_01965 [Kwoniella mangroviensis CBS 8507]OCF68582.1 hypothetical protein I203_01965 [Kwoniella mangroviensis CBS 8507]
MPPSSPTLLTPYGYSSGTCGYCSPAGKRSQRSTSSKYGMVAEQMTPEFYQLLIDRGWRRSGDYVYHPDMARTCCPQYTIRLNSTNFKGNKKHRQVVNRFNRFLETGQKPGEEESSSTINVEGKAKAVNGKGKGKGKDNKTSKRDFLDDLHRYEIGYIQKDEEESLAHRFETKLVPAKATSQTFELYKAYQTAVHKDKPEKVTMRGFDRFLCGKTLIDTPIKYTEDVEGDIKDGQLPKTYGQYHLLYKVDTQIIGISVIDILPNCVSSVYFIWHPDWAWASLGKLSALYEISLARRMREKGAQGMEWVYMGYWIPDCQKMKYKSEYSPSELLDPGTNTFHLLDKTLETFVIKNPKGYFPFANVTSSHSTHNKQDGANKLSSPDKDAIGSSDNTEEVSDEELDEESPSTIPNPPPPGFEDMSRITDEDVEDVLLLMGRNKYTKSGGKLIPIINLEFRNQQAMYTEIKEFLSAVGKDNVVSTSGGISGKAVLYLG